MNKIVVSSSEFREIHGIPLNAQIACYPHPLGQGPMMDTRYVIPFGA